MCLFEKERERKLGGGGGGGEEGRKGNFLGKRHRKKDNGYNILL